MNTKSIQRVKNSIFPIFHFGPQGFGICGTGFFIDDKGHFLTANHVINSKPPLNQFGYMGNLPYNALQGKPFIPVSILFQDPNKDLAMGLITTGNLLPLKLARRNADIGQSISLCGYPPPLVPNPQVQKSGQQQTVTLQRDQLRQYWQTTIKMDEFPRNSIFKMPFASFLTQHASIPGMSGGPIIDLIGDVVGVASANVSRQIARPNTTPLILENGVGIELAEVQSFVVETLKLVRTSVSKQ